MRAVAVVLGLDCGSRADVAAGAGFVVDDERLAQRLGELLRHDARDGVVGTAGCLRHDQRHLLVRTGQDGLSGRAALGVLFGRSKKTRSR